MTRRFMIAERGRGEVNEADGRPGGRKSGLSGSSWAGVDPFFANRHGRARPSGKLFPTWAGVFRCRDNMPAANRFPPDGPDGSLQVPCVYVCSHYLPDGH